MASATASLRTPWTISLLVLGLLSGCAIGVRTHPQFADRLRSIKTVALMPPDVRVYQLNADGTRQLIGEWSDAARGNIANAILTEFGTHEGLAVRDFEPGISAAADAECQEVLPMFRALTSSILADIRQAQTDSEGKAKALDYSLGPLPAVREATDADGALFVYAVDHILTADRVALEFLKVLLSVPSWFAYTPGHVIYPRFGHTMIVVGLVDPMTGEVLWFNGVHGEGIYDLRSAWSTGNLVKEVIGGLQGAVSPSKESSATEQEPH